MGSAAADPTPYRDAPLRARREVEIVPTGDPAQEVLEIRFEVS